MAIQVSTNDYKSYIFTYFVIIYTMLMELSYNNLFLSFYILGLMLQY
jgi:hypothetical protein